MKLFFNDSVVMRLVYEIYAIISLKLQTVFNFRSQGKQIEEICRTDSLYFIIISLRFSSVPSVHVCVQKVVEGA